MAIRPSDAIEVKRVRGKGRGVFARRPIRKGEVVESCPVLVLPPEAIGDPAQLLWSYGFEWEGGKVALALGFGSLYNHSYRPNARYDAVGPMTKNFTAIRDIAAGEEITVNYNGEPNKRKKVWFDVVEDDPPAPARRRKRPSPPDPAEGGEDAVLVQDLDLSETDLPH